MRVDNNFNLKNTPSFGKIKSIRCEGEYKKEPALAKELVDVFAKNTDAMAFAKKYDVDIVFYAHKNGKDKAESSLIMFYDNPLKSKARKFFEYFADTKDKIQLTAHGQDWENSLKESTHHLKMYMYSSDAGMPVTGVLSAHLRNADEALSKKMKEKEKSVLLNDNKKVEKTYEKILFKKSTQELNSTIKSLIDESN